MPSFLSKVFGRKKQDDKDSSGHGSDPSLLEGKFEAVSPNVSPTAEKFVDGTSTKDKEDKQKPKDKGKDNPFSLLKSKSATSSPDVTTPKSEPFSHLTLNLPGLKDDDNARALGVVFEADPSQLVLSDAIIGSRRLTSLETLVLVRACSQAIMARGLETLGIMHPHWHSSSPEVQRKLISLFIHSLAPKSPITTLSPTLSAPTSAFESEINSTRSPHDVAAVLRWGLRHMQMDSFGKDDDWYKSFFEAEKSAQYPPTAFSDLLAPKIPATHLELLTATLDLFSSLAAHAEANSISGSKLSKLVGLWLLTAERAQPGEDWHSFYSRWDKMGRMLEHLFLSHVRNEAANHRMPKRLMELVQYYPYVKGSSPSPDHDVLLPRPRFSTQRYDALFVRVDSELPSGFSEDKSASPDLLKLITNALKADATGNGAPYELWQKVKLVAVEEETANEQGPLTSSASVRATENLSRILADETIRLLSLRNTKQQQAAQAALEFKLDMGALPTGRANGHSKSASVDHTANGNGNALKHGPSTSEGANSSSPSDSPTQNTSLGTDWTQFSRSGFLESSVGIALAATLMDRDVEVTLPKDKRSRSLGRRSRPTSPRRSTKTAELPPLAIPSGEKNKSQPSVFDSEAFNNSQLPTKVTQVSFLQLDEAFIDFWSDALVDPISSDWPRFVICRFKNSVLPRLEVDSRGEGNEGKKLEWMVIEQVYSKPVSVSQPVSGGTSDSTHETPERRGRPSSPRASLSSARQRFSIFSSTFGSKSKAEKEKDKDTKKKDKGDKGVKIGEMGEILKEEDEGEKKEKNNMKKRSSWIARKSVDKEKEKEQGIKKEDGSSVPVAGIAAAATDAVAVAGAATVISATQTDEVKEKNEGDKAEEKPVEAKEQPAVIAEPAESVDEEHAPLPVPVPEPKDVGVKEKDPVVTAAPELPEPGPAAVIEEEEPVEEKIVEEPVTESPAPVAEEEKLVEEVPAAAAEPEPTPAPESEPTVEAIPVVEEVPVDEEKVAEEPVAVTEPEPAPTPEPEPTVEAAPVIEEVPAKEDIAVEPEPTPVVPPSVVKEEEETAEEPITTAEPTTDEPAVDSDSAGPEQAKPVEDILIEYAPIIGNPAIIPPDTISSDNVLEPTGSVIPALSAPEPVASFAVPTAVQEKEEDTVQVLPVQIEPLRETSPGPAEDTHVSLPAVPVVETEIPTSEPSADAPSVDLIGDTPSPQAVEPTPEVVDSGLPPAPESVVASGGTPGPQVALSSSEPAATALIEAESEKESEPQVPPGLGDASEKLATDVADAKDVSSSEAKEASSGKPEAEEKAESTPAS